MNPPIFESLAPLTDVEKEKREEPRPLVASGLVASSECQKIRTEKRK